jgi:hypothetical protein
MSRVDTLKCPFVPAPTIMPWTTFSWCYPGIIPSLANLPHVRCQVFTRDFYLLNFQIGMVLLRSLIWASVHHSLLLQYNDESSGVFGAPKGQ